MYIALGPYCWGRAATTGEAIRAMRRAKPSFVKNPMPYNVFEVTEDGWVDAHGNVNDSVKPKMIREVRFVGAQRIVKEKFND